MPDHSDIRWQRIQETFSALESRPILRHLFQICSRLFRLLLRIERGIKRLLPRKKPDFPDTLAGLDLSRGMRVLIIAEDRIPQCWRYRVAQKLEQLMLVGVDAKAVAWTDAIHSPEVAKYYHVVIFYRVPGYDYVLDLIRKVRGMGKLVLYETDDVIFDAEIQHEVFASSYRQISRKLQKQVLNGAEYYRKAMQACSYAIASTPSLAEQMERWMGEGRVLVHPNGLDQLSERTSPADTPSLTQGATRLIYGSGTRTHDADLAMIAPALAEVMEQFPKIRLVLVGYISTPEVPEEYVDRIDRLPLLDAENYLEVLRHTDINLAPLKPGVFADSKSEIKWLEAAALGVPSVVSATRTFRDTVADGSTGFVAETHDDWVKKLSALIIDPALRESLGAGARQAALVKYQARNLGKRLKNGLLKMAGDEGAIVQDNRTAVMVLGGDLPAVWKEKLDQRLVLSQIRSIEQTDSPVLNDEIAYFRPDILLQTGIIPDYALKVFLESELPFILLLQDVSWLVGKKGQATAPELAIPDPVELMKYVDTLDAALTSRRQLAKLAEQAREVFTASEDLASLYRSAGYENRTVSAEELASLLNSSKSQQNQ